MALRIGPGPVFRVELVSAARRWQSYAVRAGEVSMLLAALGLVCLSFEGDYWYVSPRQATLSLGDYARIGTAFVDAILGTQLALILLIAPAATAGAICLDKSRGNLALLMSTDLSTSEIVLGKLGARLGPVLMLVATSLPVLFIVTMMGGVNIDQLTLGFVVLIGSAVLGCSLALWLSVHVGRTQEALLIAYVVIMLWLIAFPIAWYLNGPFLTGFALYQLALLNPFVLLFEPSDPKFGATITDYLVFIALTFGCSAVFVLFSIFRLRSVVLKSANAVRKSIQRRRNRVSDVRLLNRDVLRWYERHRRRPSRAGQFVWFLYILIGVGTVGFTFYSRHLTPIGSDVTALTGGFVVGLGLLLAMIGAVTALADERTRGSLDILLLTPVPTRAILWAKWRAAFSVAPRLLMFLFVMGLITALTEHPGLPAWVWRNTTKIDHLETWTLLLLLVIHPLAFAAMFTSLGLLLATRLKRFGQCIGVAVACYAGIVVIFPLLARMLLPGLADHWAVSLFSPAWAAMAILEHLDYYALSNYFGRPDSIIPATIITIVIYLVLAAFFYTLTWIMFDRKMGRISRDRPVAIEDRSIWTKPVLGRRVREVVE